MGGLLAKLFVAIEADLSEFGKEMAQASADAVKQTGLITRTLDKLGTVVGPAFGKLKTLARVTVKEMGPILADGMKAAALAGGAAFSAKAAEGDIWGGLQEGLEAAIQVGSASIIDGISSELLPALWEASGGMEAVKKAAFAMGGAVKGMIPIIGAMGKAMMGLMLSPLGLVVLAVAAVVAAFVYWDEIKVVIDKVAKVISDFWTANIKPTFDKIMAIVEQVVAIWKDTFGKQIEAVVAFVSALLKGDFKGAWQAAKDFIFATINGMIGIIQAIAPNAIESVRKMYVGVKTWIMDKLSAVFNWLQGKLEAVGGYFFDLYDAVVGNSYIPDMVDGIGEHIARLQALMVDPIDRATKSAGDAMKKLRGDVLSLLESLFPLQNQLKQNAEDLQLLFDAYKAGEIDASTFSRARQKLIDERDKLRDELRTERAEEFGVQLEEIEIFPDSAKRALEADLAEIPELFEDRVEEPIMDSIATIAEGIGDMVSSVGDAISGLVDAFENGGFVEKIESIADTIISIIGGLEGLGVIKRQPTEGRAVGGRVRPFGSYMVGENGPEILRTGPGGGHIYNNRETQNMLAANSNGGGAVRVMVDVQANDYFDAKVRKITKPGLERATQEGAIGGNALSTRQRIEQNERRIPG